ncbi:hypothetical protein [Paenibacillus ehimensis]|uniref:Uncharacterized protein n=1 Tax=Paenibacillus ehimensis TaxID=79264 RepID=A0ABT8V7R8_9BACL|nr:hypothetical protein [Paenibacillus ehimensis]MDO3677489.1 hypothetical protein [Paenibacillus ehimensis]
MTINRDVKAAFIAYFIFKMKSQKTVQRMEEASMQDVVETYQQEEIHLLGMIQVCETCRDIILNFVRQQNGKINCIVMEDLLISLFKIEMEQRENLLHMQLAKARLSSAT